MTIDKEMYALAERLGAALRQRGWMAATAESCTGGWIGQAITMVPGSSEWFDCGFITYTNRAKMTLLDVSADTLQTQGAVSEATVREMVAGALRHSGAHVAVAVSGVAGPAGGTTAKPVGTVWLAWGLRGGGIEAQTVCFPGDRDAVRRLTVMQALEGLRARAANAP